MKIYTKSGDKGMTSLYGGTRVSKSHAQIEAFGTVDELNSWIGFIQTIPAVKDQLTLLTDVQSRLFDIGSWLAADIEKENLKLPQLNVQTTEQLEHAIDQMNEELAPLSYFILPGGNEEIARIHIARTVCRRAERQVVLMSEFIRVNELIVPLLNRISDYLFILARYTAMRMDVKEIPWKAAL